MDFCYLIRRCIVRCNANMGGTTEAKPFVPHALCFGAWEAEGFFGFKPLLLNKGRSVICIMNVNYRREEY